MRETAVVALMLVVVMSTACRRGSDDGASPGSAVIVFENVRVLPMTDEAALDGQTVVVEGDRIRSVSPSGGEIPAGARVIEGDGATLMPGLADMHVHYVHAYYPDAIPGALYLINGVTTVRQTWGDSLSFKRDALTKAGAITGPHIYTSGPLMDGPEPAQGGALVIASPAEARAAVAAQAAAGFRAIKLYEKLDADTFRAAVAAAREHEMQVWTHTPQALDILDLIELRVDSIEHLDNYASALVKNPTALDRGPASLHGWDRVDDARMRDVAERVARAGVWNVPTLVFNAQIDENMLEPDAFLERPEVRYLAPFVIGTWRKFGPPPGGLTTEEAVELGRAGEPGRERFVKALYDAGAGLLVGTDAPNPFVVPGYSYHLELANLSRAGIPNDALLRMATADAARFLGEEGEFGVIAPGARADLILVDGDPLTELAALREPNYVMTNGHLRSRAELASELEAVAVRFAADDPDAPRD